MSAISGISSAASLYQTLSSNTETQGVRGHHHGGGQKGNAISLLDPTSTTNSTNSTNGSSTMSDLASSLLDAIQAAGAATTGITVNQLG